MLMLPRHHKLCALFQLIGKVLICLHRTSIFNESPTMREVTSPSCLSKEFWVPSWQYTCVPVSSLEKAFLFYYNTLQCFCSGKKTPVKSPDLSRWIQIWILDLSWSRGGKTHQEMSDSVGAYSVDNMPPEDQQGRQKRVDGNERTTEPHLIPQANMDNSGKWAKCRNICRSRWEHSNSQLDQR